MLVLFSYHKYIEAHPDYISLVYVKDDLSKLLYNASATYFNNITDDECNKILKMVNRK